MQVQLDPFFLTGTMYAFFRTRSNQSTPTHPTDEQKGPKIPSRSSPKLTQIDSSSDTTEDSLEGRGETVRRASRPVDPKQQVKSPLATSKEADIITVETCIKYAYERHRVLLADAMNGLKYIKALQVKIENQEIAMRECQSNIEFYERQIERLEGEKKGVEQQHASSLSQTGVLQTSQVEMLEEEYEQTQRRIEEQGQRWIDRLVQAKKESKSLEKSLSSARDTYWVSWRLLGSYDVSLADITNCIEELVSPRPSYVPEDLHRDMDRIESNLSKSAATVRNIVKAKKTRSSHSSTEFPHSSEV
ncbi:hypothetical protein FRC16_004845 [Serendipita sp. 398]|nr:hypothetical protein FRC16_004845 [Serendipita sp. 398]